MAKVEDKFIREVMDQTDVAIDSLDALARNLKGDQLTELKRQGFDLERIALGLASWQRSFRRCADALNNPAPVNG